MEGRRVGIGSVGTLVALAAGAATAAAAPRPAHAEEAPCSDAAGVAIWRSPQAPDQTTPLRIMAVGEETAEAELTLLSPGGAPERLSVERRGGPPFSFFAEIERPAPGVHVAKLVAPGGRVLACERISVAARVAAPVRSSDDAGVVWKSRLRWEADTESFYAAWIEKLFDAPPTESPGWRPLHDVLRDRKRNFLFGHLGLREDDTKNRKGLVAAPDCADLPYTLRAYFAWKMGLPFGMRDCSRGTSTAPPRCGELVTNEQPPKGTDLVSSFNRFLRLVANTVHSGSGRAKLDDDGTDTYPVALTRKTLRPGTVFADPYGHLLVLTKWVPQSATASGILFGVDGQPDGSIGRKRFWEGNFLWSSETAAAGPGFKAFRPLVRPPAAGQLGGSAGRPAPLVALGNRELAKDQRFATYSAEQAGMPADAFYAQMGRLINPKGVDAGQAYRDTLDALVESLKVRLGSVDNGEKYMRESRYPVVEMPSGPKIFETIGAWEDYATPSRDMRLIIAMNVLVGLPDKVIRHPDLFLLGGKKPEALRDELRAMHGRLTGERSIEYVRSDGSRWKLTVADVMARKKNFEISYNPNDCVEVRWGATPGTDEYATCKRRAPAEQQARMTEYRPWFAEARRPPR